MFYLKSKYDNVKSFLVKEDYLETFLSSCDKKDYEIIKIEITDYFEL